MDSDDPKVDYTVVIDSVMHLFGEVMSQEVISAVVEHYSGDLNQSIDAIMKMSEDGIRESDIHPSPHDKTIPSINNVPQHHMAQIQNAPSTASISKPPQSYCAASQSKAAVKKRLPNSKSIPLSKSELQMKQILEYHKQGYRTMILIRGVPGSGKSHLAKQLLQYMCPGAIDKTHIFSSDDYFMVKGEYKYDKSRLVDAHNWNQNRVREAASRGLSPIIVDNTHVKIWEMEPYVKYGVYCGYIIEVVEPNTPWAKKANQCAYKNTHNVPINTIRRMLDNYEDVESGVYLLKAFRLSYPVDKVPPVMRNFPSIMPPQQSLPDQNPSTSSQLLHNMSMPTNTDAIAFENQQSLGVHIIQSQNTLTQLNDGIQIKPTPEVGVTQTQSVLAQTYVEAIGIQYQQEPSVDNTPTTNICMEEEMVASEDKSKPSNSDNLSKEPKGVDAALTPEAIEKLRKKFEEIEKLDQLWENGENWDDTIHSNTSNNIENEGCLPLNPLPPRNNEVESVGPEKFLSTALDTNDWTKISMYLPAWNDYKPSNVQVTPNVPIETASVATSVEYGDTDTNNKNFKILIGTPKDINFYYMGINEEKIPDKRMLDKSSMTNDHDHIVTESFRCPNEESHFITLMNMFPSISSDYLRDIFDKCLGDVNWAVNIIFDSVKIEELPTVTRPHIPESEHLDKEPCDCLAAYNVIPNINTKQVQQTATEIQDTPEIVAGPSTPKIKKEKTILESSLLLKRQIEKNVVISDNHYSQHCLKIRKMRRGEVNDSRGDSAQDDTEESSATATSDTADTVTQTTLSTDEDDSQTSCSDDCERTVNVDLGPVFVSELDEIFGRHDMQYSESLATRVNMPVSLLNEINALWMESLMYQLEQLSHQSELMLRQDEEFARQLACKEEELAQAGREPAIPNLKEIMDMELALSIYKKEITAEWRNNVPNDLASRMTREKLYNLFPDVAPDTLSELLMAHDNNFNATVEVLLSSTGNAQILEEENGVAKFIAKKELERQKKILEEEKKALSEVEWPLLPKDVKADMKMVQDYRAQASQFLSQRNLYYQKAQEFYRRDMTGVATYYSEVAGMHKRRFEQANSLAAASLMQVHALNSNDNTIIDLHFLHVPEAKETLDLFLDTHIQKLRELQSKSQAPRCHDLYFITGRGRHSHGGPKIKPATKRRLRERGIAFSERNPGLLSSKVRADDKMTYELP